MWISSRRPQRRSDARQGQRAAESQARHSMAQGHGVRSSSRDSPRGEGYFSIVEGHNERLYIGTHANGVNSWLVEFNPRIGGMKVVVDAHKAIGIDRKGFASPGQDPHPQQCRQEREDLLRHQARISGAG